MVKIPYNIANFIRVSPAQQTVAGICIPALTWNIYDVVEKFSQGSIGLGLASTGLAIIGIGAVSLNEYNAAGKMREYVKVKKALEKRGWSEEIVEPKSHSWCQRHMLQVASNDAGFGEETRDYLYKKGYRKYNLLQRY